MPRNQPYKRKGFCAGGRQTLQICWGLLQCQIQSVHFLTFDACSKCFALFVIVRVDRFRVRLNIFFTIFFTWLVWLAAMARMTRMACMAHLYDWHGSLACTVSSLAVSLCKSIKNGSFCALLYYTLVHQHFTCINSSTLKQL